MRLLAGTYWRKRVRAVDGGADKPEDATDAAEYRVAREPAINQFAHVGKRRRERPADGERDNGSGRTRREPVAGGCTNPASPPRSRLRAFDRSWPLWRSSRA